MVYLYAALGVVMMTGIMAVFEMGLSISGQSLILKPLLNSAQKDSINELKGLDQDLLHLLYKKHEVDEMLDPLLDPLGSQRNSPLRSSSLCGEILCRINREKFCLGEKSDGNELPPPVSSLEGLGQSSATPSGEWSDACALDLVEKKYRFLIRPDSQINEQFPYYMYSCILSRETSKFDPSKCDFELGVGD